MQMATFLWDKTQEILPQWNNLGFTLCACLWHLLFSISYLFLAHGTLWRLLPVLFQHSLLWSNSHRGSDTSAPFLGMLTKPNNFLWYYSMRKRPLIVQYQTFDFCTTQKILLVALLLLFGHFSQFCLTHCRRCCSIILSGRVCNDTVQRSASWRSWQFLLPEYSIITLHLLKHATLFSAKLLKTTCFPCFPSGLERLFINIHNGIHPSSALSEVAVWTLFVFAEEK